MRHAFAVLAFFLLVLQAQAAGAATPLVDAAWMKANAGTPGLVVLDIRNKLGKGSKESYLAGHIPGAVYSDYLADGWRTTVDGVPGQLPPVADLEKLIGALGIGNGSHVVVVAGGVSALDMGSATRVYWTFKVLGHDAVSVLDGGWKAYAADPANPVETGANAPTPASFTASFRPEMIADRGDVQAAMAEGVPLIDMRPPAQYRGEKTHTRWAHAVMHKAGIAHIYDNSITVKHDWRSGWAAQTANALVALPRIDVAPVPAAPPPH